MSDAHLTPPSSTPASASAGTPLATMQRTPWDVILGVVLIVTGAFVLGDVVLASVISVLFLGWSLLIGGLLGLAVALVQIRRDGSWIGILGSALAFVAGLVFVRYSGVALLALSLAIGAVMIVAGVTRLVAAAQLPEQRLLLISSGVLGLVLGLMILNRWPSSALWLLGTLLGVHVIVDGVLLILVGRPRLTAASS
jgi:membrane protein HdeD